jgi:hypothetical protein
MARCAIGYGDRVQAAAALTATSERADSPASWLRTDDLTQTWRAAAGVTSTTITVDFGRAEPIGWVAFGNAGFASPTLRFRLSLTDPTGAAGDAYDSGSLAFGALDQAYRKAIHLLPGEASGRHLRVDVADATPEAGRLWAGRLWRPARNYAYPLEVVAADLSERRQADGGQVWVNRRSVRRGFRMTLPAVSKAEWETHLERLQRLTGATRDVLLCRDPDAPNLPRECVIGPPAEGQSVEAVFEDFGRYRASLPIDDRL